MASIFVRSSCNSCLEMAFRAAGRASDRMRIRPEEGAGTSITFMTGVGWVE